MRGPAPDSKRRPACPGDAIIVQAVSAGQPRGEEVSRQFSEGPPLGVGHRADDRRLRIGRRFNGNGPMVRTMRSEAGGAEFGAQFRDGCLQCRDVLLQMRNIGFERRDLGGRDGTDIGFVRRRARCGLDGRLP